MKSYNEIIFEALEIACLTEGGDGDSALICPNYNFAADKFEEWLNQTNNTWWKRENYETFVLFSNNQEAIWFSDNENIDPYLTTIIKTIWLS